MLTPYGRTETIFTEDFLAKTRFENTEMTLLEKNSFIFGLRSKNCVYFIEKEIQE